MSPMTSIYGITVLALLLSPAYVWYLYVHEYRKLGVELLSLYQTKKKSLIFNMIVAFAVVYVVLLATNTSFLVRHPIELRSIDDYKFFYTSTEPEKDIANGLALRNHYLADRDDTYLTDAYCSRNNENCYFGWVQSLFTVYISPFVYQGKLPETNDTAAILQALYENNTADNISIQKLNVELEKKEIFTFDGFASRLRTVSGPRNVLTSEIKSIDVTVSPRPSEKVQNGKMTFIFANPERRQGEAIFDVVLPPDAKITGLTLGRNLENRSYVVPDFAADKVYEDSVRRTIDPAVVKQIGPSTFRMRVFPVFSETTDIRNMQKIAVTYVAPLNGPVIPPVIYTQTGTTLTDKTSKYTVISENGTQVTTDVRDFTKFSQTAESAYACVANKTMTYENSAIFIDITKSAEKSREKYSVLLSHFSDDLMVTVYLVNHQINEVPQKISIKQLKSDLGKATFWGHSSEDAWREAMQYRTGGYSNIVILSDNDVYVKEAEKIDLYDFTTLRAANIMILSSHIGALQDAKLVYSAIARRANVLFIDSENNVIPYTTYCDISGYANSPDATVRAIKDVSDIESKIMNATVKDNYVQQMKEITKIAQQYNVVALGNSMIAIETEEQRRALEAESGKDSVYDLTNLIGIGLPENNALGLFIIINAGFVLVYLYEKKKVHTTKASL
jgi:hypothetical protein